jgi:RNase adapter protein RapZ
MNAAPSVVFVSGLSGSGKSTAMNALEDLGFYCVDNLPAQLTSQFLDLCSQADPPIARVALAIDAREERFLAELPPVLEELRHGETRVRVLFLDCATEVLVDRYRETRRVHPLSPGGSVEEGIARERELLGDVARLADLRLDSSDLNVHELRRAIADWASAGGGARGPVVSLVSFGFRYGLPRAADLVFDVRFLPNPHFEPLLRPRSGLDAEVARFVLETSAAKELLDRLGGLLGFLLPMYEREGKSYLTVAVGCTGGRHRSVAVLEAIAGELRRAGQNVSVTHRDVEKT